MSTSDEDCGDLPPQVVPFPVSMRSRRRRGSRLSRQPSSPSACEESIHYPVFNPKDPRHNPALERTMCQGNVDNVPQTTYPSGSMRWMQGLPGRSLRRARSGIQALRSGLQRRPVRSDDEQGSNGLWSSSDSAGCSSDTRGCRFSSNVSEASTEEDYTFGTDLYRTGCNCPDSKGKSIEDIGLPSYFPPSHLSTIPALSTETESIVAFPVEVVTDIPSNEDSPITTDLTAATADEGPPVTKLDDHCSADQAIVSESPAFGSDSQPTTQEEPDRDLPKNIILQTAMEDDELKSSTDQKSSHVSVKKTNTNSITPKSSSSSLKQLQVEHVPCDGTEVTVTAKEIHPTGTNEDDTLEASGGKTSAMSKPNNTPPEVQLGDLGGMDYYLSLDTLGATESHEKKASDEEPSPDSFSSDDRDARLSPWVPAEKGDRTSLLSFHDEYFFVDGKSTDLRPDRGDNPVKSERAFTGDGALHSGPGLDRHVSGRTHEIPEIIGPGGPVGMPSPRPFRRDREGSDSTEEYLVTYSLLHRHYFS
ncbi:hypothetical protein BDV18DRAFT_114638 [Aspergillus unguis]